MNTVELCQELMQLDIVKIQLIPHVGTSMSVPFQIPNIATLGGTLATAALTLALTDASDVDAIFSASGSTVKVTSAREQAGIIRTHALSALINRGMQQVRALESSLAGNDYHIVLTNAAGQRFFSYGLPNTTQLSLDDTMGSNAQLSLKLQLKSMSGLILLS